MILHNITLLSNTLLLHRIDRIIIPLQFTADTANLSITQLAELEGIPVSQSTV